MINKIQLKGFKRFKEQIFTVQPMTLLAGSNSAGKTSVIHALLLAREAWRRNDGIVELNGPFGLELGGFEDVLNRESQETFTISLTCEDGAANEWVFSEGDTELYATVSAKTDNLHPIFVAAPRAFQYLSAERLGPRITQASAALPPAMLEVGYQGQYCAQVLETLGKISVDNSRRCLQSVRDDVALLKAQTENWLSQITRPIQLDTETFPGTSIAALRFRIDEDWIKPTNMGFGVTYALPIVLAGLTAGAGGLLIVENPEAHLHPKGQSQMGRFLASMAAAGVQLVIETHSDHVINGIRRAIGEQGILSSEKAIIHFFVSNNDFVQSLRFTKSGGISDWPSGFFDQYQLDVMALTRVRRPR